MRSTSVFVLLAVCVVSLLATRATVVTAASPLSGEVSGTGLWTGAPASEALKGSSFILHSVASVDGHMVANGVLHVKTASGRDETHTVTLPINKFSASKRNGHHRRLLQAAGSAACPILSLSTGAIHLNLLGLVLDIAPININLVAQGGAGNLLGNLLCAVANLLNGPALGPLDQLLLSVTTLLISVLGGL